jgi:hypothetical protein
MLRLFDFPDPNITSGGRVETTVPLQQLFVLNSEFMTTNARAVAERLLTASPPGQRDTDCIRQAYLMLYGRPVTDRELKLGAAYLQAPEPVPTGAGQLQNAPSRWQRYAQALLATNEFFFSTDIHAR